MGIAIKRGGRAPLDEDGASIIVPTRFGKGDLARVEKAATSAGYPDRSAFIRQAALDKADITLNADQLQWKHAQHAEAAARKHDTAVVTAVEGELFAATAELIGRRTPFAWGGGTITGPSLGLSDGGGLADECGDYGKVGFDAGSLGQFLLFRAFQIEIPRTMEDQFKVGRRVDEPEAGDLVFCEGPVSGLPAHVATYLGRGCIAEARRSGELIGIRAIPATGVQLRRLTP